MEPAARPADLKDMPAIAEPNISATVWALNGLRAAGASPDDPAVRAAGLHRARCQNFPDSASGGRQPPDSFDDGGFVFMPDDVTRNKAGVAGTDNAGRTALFLVWQHHGRRPARAAAVRPAGRASARRGRVEMGRDELPRRTATPAITPRTARAPAPESFSTTARALAAALRLAGIRQLAGPAGPVDWADAMATELARRQAADGSWVNTGVAHRGRPGRRHRAGRPPRCGIAQRIRPIRAEPGWSDRG